MQKETLNKLIFKTYHLLTLMSKTTWEDLRYNQLGQRFLVKPTTLNLLVNDICNSHCQMCLIWKRKKEKEISPSEFARILQDPLFGKLRAIGVSGGEPTLRSDLPDFFQVIAEKKPPITSANIITNAIQADKVLSSVLSVAEICKKAGIRFSVMVSLDGVGEVHDRIRGVQGNFTQAIQVLRYLRDKTDIPFLFGCTITKDNVWHVDELLDFARSENLYGRFRIAEFIHRLYNESQYEYIRNFSAEEKFHLSLFFTKLEHDFENNSTYRRTYRNIRSMLNDSCRIIGCPYQNRAVVLDSRGQLIYCSPKSPIIGNTLEDSAIHIYRKNIHIRRQIIASDCTNCVHDYHSNATIKELLDNTRSYTFHRKFHVKRVIRNSKNVNYHKASLKQIDLSLIIGWYGTETAGDKAILGEIIHQLHLAGNHQIMLASFNPFISVKTLQELGETGVKVIPVYSADYLRAAKIADETIMGGGPLMDLAALGPMLEAFSIAKRNNKRTRIAGCGIGPLVQQQYIETVKELMRLADIIELRDQASVDWAMINTGRSDITRVDDPSSGFIQRWLSSQSFVPEKQNTLNCYFREWPIQYSKDIFEKQFRIQSSAFEEQLGNWVNELCEQYSLHPRLLAMHHFVIGGDDREFNRRFAKKYLSRKNPIIEIRPYSVYDILKSIQCSSLCITMRFHSTLFAHILGADYLAIDYTCGGKVFSFLKDQNALNHLVTIEQITNGNWPLTIKA